MEITVTGRHVTVSDRYRRHVEEKLTKIGQLEPRVTRCDVVLTHEPNPRQAKESERIEITCHAKRTVIRAEASADEEYGALDLAMGRLLERLRRQPTSVAEATADLPTRELGASDGDDAASNVPAAIQAIGGDEDCPVQLREKVHTTHPMTVDEALSKMELVGHDFYLYQDADTGKASVVYRRRGWSYGVMHLEVEPVANDAPEQTPAARPLQNGPDAIPGRAAAKANAV